MKGKPVEQSPTPQTELASAQVVKAKTKAQPKKKVGQSPEGKRPCSAGTPTAGARKGKKPRTEFEAKELEALDVRTLHRQATGNFAIMKRNIERNGSWKWAATDDVFGKLQEFAAKVESTEQDLGAVGTAFLSGAEVGELVQCFGDKAVGDCFLQIKTVFEAAVQTLQGQLDKVAAMHAIMARM